MAPPSPTSEISRTSAPVRQINVFPIEPISDHPDRAARDIKDARPIDLMHHDHWPLSRRAPQLAFARDFFQQNTAPGSARRVGWCRGIAGCRALGGFDCALISVAGSNAQVRQKRTPRFAAVQRVCAVPIREFEMEDRPNRLGRAYQWQMRWLFSDSLSGLSKDRANAILEFLQLRTSPN